MILYLGITSCLVSFRQSTVLGLLIPPSGNVPWTATFPVQGGSHWPEAKGMSAAQATDEASPLRQAAAAAPPRSLAHQVSISANIDLIAKLRRQLEERDAEIAGLKVRACPEQDVTWELPHNGGCFRFLVT